MRPNEPKFEAERYFANRPFYPKPVYRLLEKELARTRKSPERFLDLACGAGQSLSSFLNHFPSRPPEGFAVDLDPAMLGRARDAYAGVFPGLSFLEGGAEKIPLPDAAVDLVLIGSAFHWFEPNEALPELARVLTVEGRLFIYEYQFPKCLDSPALHEAVRRRFNLEWKAPRQTPRGTLTDLMAPFRASREWLVLGEEKPEWREVLTLEAFLGHLFSQSRYLHAESAQPDSEAYRAEITEFFRPFFSSGELRFDLKPGAVLLKKASQKTENSL